MPVSFSHFDARYKSLIGSALIMVLLGAVQPYLWSFTQARVEQWQFDRTQDQQISKLKARNEAIKATLVEQQEYVDQVDVVAPPANSLTQIVERIEQLADRRGLEFKYSLIDEELDAAKFGGAKLLKPVMLSVSVSGGIDAVLTYIQDIEHAPEIAVIAAWQLKPLRQKSQNIGPVVEEGYTLDLDMIFFLRAQDDGSKK